MCCALVPALAACGFQHGEATDDAPAALDARPLDARPLDARPVDARPSDAAPPPFTFEQVASAEDMSQAGETIAFGKPQLAGDLDVVMIGWFKAGTLASVSDSAGNSYAIAAGPTTIASGMETQVIYYACGIRAGANTVTVTFQDASQDPDVRIAEYGGVASSACLDTSVSATGTTTAIDSGALATAAGHELLIGGDKVYYLTAMGDASYTTRTITGYGDLVEDRVADTAGSYHALATENQTGAWVMQLAAFAGP